MESATGLPFPKREIVLAIVGARTCSDFNFVYERLNAFVEHFGMPDRVVSGGARGADSLGEAWAHARHLPVTSYRPQWLRPDGSVNRGAGLVRNSAIVSECTHMVAFPSKSGRGTQDSIKKARLKGKYVEVYWIE